MDGGQALVGTTSLFTAEDEVIPPEPEDSTLTGASNILIQSPDACGPLHVIDHFLGSYSICLSIESTIDVVVVAPYDSGYFGLVLDALTHGGVASTSRLDKAYCLGFKGNTYVAVSLPPADHFKQTISCRLVNPVGAASALKAIVTDVFNILTASSPYVSTSEPPLPEYVCQRYPSSGFTCAPGPLQ